MCTCAGQINTHLRTKGVCLASAWAVGAEGQLMDRPIVLAVEKVPNAPRGTKLPLIFPTYCPFCGQKMEDEK